MKLQINAFQMLMYIYNPLPKALWAEAGEYSSVTEDVLSTYKVLALIFSIKVKNKMKNPMDKGWECISVVQCSTSMCETLGSKSPALQGKINSKTSKNIVLDLRVSGVL